MDPTRRPGVWRRRLRVGAHWWAERADGTWVRWSFHRADWEDMDGPPKGVTVLPPETPPRLKSPAAEPTTEDKIREAVAHWVAAFAFMTVLGVLGLVLIIVVFDFVFSLWGSPGTNLLPIVGGLILLSAGACTACIVVNIAIIRAAESGRFKRFALRRPEPTSGLTRPIRVPPVLSWGAAAAILVLIMLAVVYIKLPFF